MEFEGYLTDLPHPADCEGCGRKMLEGETVYDDPFNGFVCSACVEQAEDYNDILDSDEIPREGS